MRKSLTLSLFLALFTSAAVQADVLLPFLVNTSSVSGAQGFLDFQFNPLNASTLPETATIVSFSGATYNSTLGATLTGGATGGPAGVSNIVLSNSTSYNDAFEGVSYGKSISFTLDLSGIGITNPNGNRSSGEFDFSLFDSNQNPILTSNPNGYALTVDVNANGTIAVVPQSPNVTLTPEPSSLSLLSLPLLGLAAKKFLRRRIQ
jgi:hypothetical protein